MMETESLLTIRESYKRFGEKIVLQGLNLTLNKGEILGLFGSSGTGKSVILRTIIGLEKLDRGEIIFENRNIGGLSEGDLIGVRKKIGYVFQNGALFDSLTVEENLSYPLIEHTKLTQEQIHDKVNHMLTLIDMVGANDLYPNELSGGMQKRAGLARAIILQPQIILFDEPTAGLDPINTRRLLNNIKVLKTIGITGIFVTHDIPSAFEIADRIAILYKGKIYVVDTVENIKNSQDPLVQSFVNSQHEVEQMTRKGSK
jgi:phospholipid/cholesterol/gamma-HCH transport system ATP-binding protein